MADPPVRQRVPKNRRSTIKTFALLAKIAEQNEDSDLSAGASDNSDFNTLTNLPYAVMNLAKERHNNRHKMSREEEVNDTEPGQSKPRESLAVFPSASPRPSTGGSRRSSSSARKRGNSSGLFKGKTQTTMGDPNDVELDEDKGNEAGTCCVLRVLRVLRAACWYQHARSCAWCVVRGA